MRHLKVKNIPLIDPAKSDITIRITNKPILTNLPILFYL